ncbi:hypothetical protein EDF58_102200 [Novosphingobium sp. PhB57]|uniref:hypothetical protein n=1 Tax=Novosphingobium sp. PhB57 TaxID=2485107 RepID=UPI00104459B0|nr:hypothetical protein [Novosphingobium sp. PhB57]TCU59517.1 hypothetical protein EDF58_102200 [Novosphingobium sp. PhB57]
MRMPSRPYLFGAAALALLGAGVAEAATARLHTMNVAAPDGSQIQVRYFGDTAPQVEVVPVEAAAEVGDAGDASDASDGGVMADPFMAMARISAAMDARMDAMMQQAALVQRHAAQMQQQAVAGGHAQGAPGVILAGDMPAGSHVTYYSSSTDARGCTRSVSYSSDGSGAAPKMTQAASDGCDAAGATTRAIPAALPARIEPTAEQQVPPGRKV